MSEKQPSFKKKIKSQQELMVLRQSLISPVVFTNGCFDLIHIGHIRYLNEAKNLGSTLIVGLNSDKSVTKLKGSSRPLISHSHRAETLAALSCVDFITIFDEDTPYGLIKDLRPNILVKGGDWKIKDIVGSDLVLKSGGSVLSLPYVQGFSTTALIEKMRNTSL
ncbi:MAG: D-glycero-beta-D-manno-heptose 1-phosphate adenylyltransferase [Deltaproteobacteria bacterium]|nr:D-glycero-beta-D-manno-heptose 1-phosphate adenylyltransferase [Deltaproteobacteria bacterium]